ncbi:uncharacterized protein LOC129589543 [Paramacrobiotus metropolitanus]|uniref:uncharacterized protein LOC129589543 n=1 Tax=Paramacrobiotus metropolitanus TaxID=2943436 RepID=UPI0024460EFD|nr:uncharacterized protein LOC129589543 [Paramacrobiotus metropolitanus]
MSSRVPQGQQRPSIKVDLVDKDKVAKVKEQLRLIRERRPQFKTLQAQVNRGRAQKNTYLTEIDSVQRDVDRITNISTYIRRKIQFYQVAAGSLQKQIDDTAKAVCQAPPDYLNPNWLRDANAELLADITAWAVVLEVQEDEKVCSLEAKRQQRVELIKKKTETDGKIRETQAETQLTMQNIQHLKRDRDQLRIFMHDHADRTFRSSTDYDAYLRRHELNQSLRYIEHRIRFVQNLNLAKLREVCSVYKMWLTSTKKDNAVLYDAVSRAWKWLPKNKVATGCRRLKHRIFGEDLDGEHEEMLEEQLAAVQRVAQLCDLQRSNFELTVKLEYSDLVSHFLRVMKVVLETQSTEGT